MTSFEYLNDTLAELRNQLKYAEAKNGTLFIAAMGFLAMLLQTYSHQNLPFPKSLLLIGLTTSIVSALVAGYTFIPKTRSEMQSSNALPQDSKVYFGDLAQTELKKIISFSQSIDAKQNDGKLALMEDLAEQILIVAKITNRKMKLFSFSITIFLLGMLTLTGSIVFSYLLC